MQPKLYYLLFVCEMDEEMPNLEFSNKLDLYPENMALDSTESASK
jgi:hypothetical protein